MYQLHTVQARVMLGAMHRSPRRRFRCSFRAITGGATVLVALAGVLALGSCSQTVRGEFSAGACTNGLDDDLDDLSDCSDPDCWVFCPTRRAVIGPSDSEFEDARVPDASMSLPISDSGFIAAPDDDGGTSKPTPDSEDDAGMPNTCRCSPNEVCVDGSCQPRLIAGEFDVSAIGAYVPLYSATDRCYDYENPGCTTRRPLVCECVPPDPYVVVLLDGKPLTKAIPPEARRTASPVWGPTAPTERVTLSEASNLEFVVYDYDGIGSDTEIFRCMPDKAPLRFGSDSLLCTPLVGMTIKPPMRGGWQITVRFAKVPPTAE